jgi:signal peptidase II
VEAGTDRDASFRPALVVAATAAILFAADQVTKALIVAAFRPGESVEVIGDFVRLWYVQNSGAAFSLFPGALWLFLPVTALALGMIVYFFRAFRDRGTAIHVVLGTILAGTLGNLVDRLRLGYVVDFISVGIDDVRFPTFNVADSAVVLGIITLVGYLTFVEDRRRQDEPAA